MSKIESLDPKDAVELNSSEKDNCTERLFHGVMYRGLDAFGWKKGKSVIAGQGLGVGAIR
jgi:hypothetical protein